MLIVETFEIDLIEVDPWSDIGQYFGRGVSVRNVRASKPPWSRLLENFDGPFGRNQRFVVRTREDSGAFALGVGN